MLLFSIDPATTSGWSLLKVTDTIDLLNYGEVSCPAGLNLPQKLNFYHIQFNRLLDMYKPNHCIIEDQILGISGAKTLTYLSRISGVIIQTAYSHVRENVHLYTPSNWKANSFPDINGSSSKWDIQLAACEMFNLEISNNLTNLTQDIYKSKLQINKFSNDTKEISIKISKLNARLKHKRNPPTSEEIDSIKKEIKLLESEKTKLKKDKKDFEINTKKRFMKITNDIYVQTGISTDIADSIGLSLCFIKSNFNSGLLLC